ncbi:PLASMODESMATA CALLOSE-BINDING PROTEIN 1-like isoform X2 [Typha latifolia]|uniref:PLASMODESMATA CALLOSE-BINDING PROTEIN 1-like isoform X2 n=1 Tax=Typha latifolia TaxID=4733 RepID=UPI003C2E7D52
MGSPAVLFVGLVVAAAAMVIREGEGAMWCIARGGGSAAALQAALDYACGPGGADCAPIQPSGLCYLPDTLSAHASYAFNSYFQRSNAAPGACDFAGAATVTVSDPSYGTCTFPSSPSTAGGSTNAPKTNTQPPPPPPPPPTTTQMTPTITPPPPTTTTPTTMPTPPGLTGGFGGLNPPGFGSTMPNVDISGSPSLPSLVLMPTFLCLILMFV